MNLLLIKFGSHKLLHVVATTYHKIKCQDAIITIITNKYSKVSVSPVLHYDLCVLDAAKHTQTDKHTTPSLLMDLSALSKI